MEQGCGSGRYQQCDPHSQDSRCHQKSSPVSYTHLSAAMMKNQLKQFLIAGAVLAVLAALFFGWRSWYYRPQTLADILPLSPEDIEACDVQMDYSDRENALCFDLTTGQFHELLDLSLIHIS